jgi:hypothetical protein
MIEPETGPADVALAPALQAFSPMALHVHRGSGDIIGRPADVHTASGSRFPLEDPREVTLRGTSEPVEIVTVEWR